MFLEPQAPSGPIQLARRGRRRRAACQTDPGRLLSVPVKFFRELAYSVEHQHIIGDRVADIAVEAQCHGRAADQLGSGDGVRAREQGHLVTQSDKFLREIGNNSLGTAIKPRLHALRAARSAQFSCFFNSRGERLWRERRREGPHFSWLTFELRSSLGSTIPSVGEP